MRKMNILISFSTILFYFLFVGNAEDPKSLSDFLGNKNCKASIKFTNCKQYKKIIYRNDDLKMRTHFVYCEKHAYIFDYVLENLDTGHDLNYHNNFGPTLIVKKFTLDPGEYRVVLHVKLSNGDSFINTEYCQLSVLKASIFPIIRGGFERYVSARNDIVLDATDSMDYTNQDPIDQENLKYEWMYNCDGCTEDQSGQGSGPEMIIKGSNHQNAARYVVRLGIQSKWWTTMTHAYQVINVRVNKPAMYIECLDNCYSEYFDQRMTFQVTCSPACTETKWKWSVYLGSGDDQSLMSDPLDLVFSEEEGTTYDLLTFNAILPDRTYLLKVTLDSDNSTQPSYKFKSMGSFDFSCNLKPFEGVILETYFYFQCTGRGYGSHFWATFYYKGANKEMILDFDSSWKYLNFTVPRRGVVTLRFSHYSGLEGEVNWDPDNRDDYFNLTDKELKLSEIDDSYNNGNESIQNSLESFEYQKALDKMSLISKSVEKINANDVKTLEPVIEKIVADLRKELQTLNMSECQYIRSTKECAVNYNL